MVLPVAEPWFGVEEVDRGVMMITEPHVARLWRANLYLVEGVAFDLLVDTGMGVGPLRQVVAGLTERPVVVFTTHSHLDHIGGHFEFADCEILVHAAEAGGLARPKGPEGLSYASLPAAKRAEYQAAGFDTSGLMVDAIPSAGYDLAGHRLRGGAAGRLIGEGEVIDMGTRRFEVLHLPGHSPGGIALWDAADGMLIAGDAIYDGILIDSTDDADVGAYRRTMARLRDLPVRVVHGGHKRAFGRGRMVEIVDGYVASRAGGKSPVAGEAGVSF